MSDLDREIEQIFELQMASTVALKDKSRRALHMAQAALHVQNLQLILRKYQNILELEGK